MCQRARGRNHARGNAPVVTVAQHDGQGNQTHRNDRRRHHAGGGRQQGTDKNDRNRQSAAHRTEQLAYGVQQILGHAGALEYQTHESEKWYGQQCVVLHDAEDAQRQCLQQRFGQHAEFNTDEAKKQATGTQAESNRKTQ